MESYRTIQLLIIFFVFVSSSIVDLLELSQQYVSTSTFLKISGVPSETSQFQQISFYYLSNQRNDTKDLEFLTSWMVDYVMPTNNLYVVHSLQYSPPFEQIGLLKSHISALSHFLLQNISQHAIIMEDTLIPCPINVSQFHIDLIQSTNSNRGVVLTRVSQQSMDHLDEFLLSSMYSVSLTEIQSFLLTLISHSSLLEYHLALRPQLCSPWTLSATLRTNILDQRWGHFPLNSFELQPTVPRHPPSSPSPFIPHTLIPKNLIMVAMGEEYVSGKDWSALSQRLLSMNPGFRLLLYTDKDIEGLWEEFPSFEQPFRDLPLVQWRSDLIRYLLLYLHGGVYLDVDLLPVLSFHRISEHCMSLPTPTSTPTSTPPGPFSFFFMRAANEPDEISNGFLSSPQHHPLLLSLAQLLVSDQPSVQYGVNVKRLFREVGRKWSIPEDYGAERSREGGEGEWACFMRERRISPREQRYVLRLDQRTVALYSNGKRNWPPPSSPQDIFLSS